MTRFVLSAKGGGFTLVEMAVVLFILGLLIAGVLGPLDTQLEARDRRQTIDTMNDVVEALYGYAITNRRLPCPDTSGNGWSDMVVEPFDNAAPVLGMAQCDGGTDFPDGEGFLPWAELNVAPGDSWGNRFRYRVRWPNFTWPEQDGICDGDDVPEEFDICATEADDVNADILVRTRGDDPSSTGILEGKFGFDAARDIPAIVISHGRNGFGATTTGGAPRAAPPAGSDEAENADDDGLLTPTYVSRRYSRENSACADDTVETTALCAFDDIVVWLSPAILYSRMVTAGRLP